MCDENRLRKKIQAFTDVRLFYQTLDKNENYSSLTGLKKIMLMDILLLS